MEKHIVRTEDLVRPGKDPHLGAKLLELLPIIYGKRGKAVVGYFSYFRWVDDVVDESTLTSQEKLGFLERQFDIVRGVYPNERYPMEDVLINISTQQLRYATDLQTKTNEVLASFVDDVQHSTYLPRREQELRLYNSRSLLMCLEAVGILINGKPIKTTKQFAELANSWNNVGTLLHLKEDLSQGLIRVFLSDEECETIEAFSDPQDRKGKFISIVNKDRFIKDRNRCASTITENIPSIFDLDIPAWQKIIAAAYMYKVAFKTRVLMKYPDIEFSVK